MIAEPSIQDMIDVASKSIRGEKEKNADFQRGSDYEALTGPCAIIWTREAARDTDLFNSVNFHSADGEDLTDMVFFRYAKERIMDTHGQGSVRLTRSTAGVAETIWSGTHFTVLGSQPRTYRVTEDTPVGSTVTAVEIPIEAVDVGSGVAISTVDVRIDDELEDPNWRVSNLECRNGTVFEKSEAFRTRIRAEQVNERPGQSAFIIQTCKDAGAGQVILFRSDDAGDSYDYGLNVCYVGDLGFSGSDELVRDCAIALWGGRVLGDNLQVLPMARVELDIIADVHLRAAPAQFDLERFKRIQIASLQHYLNGKS